MELEGTALAKLARFYSKVSKIPVTYVLSSEPEYELLTISVEPTRFIYALFNSPRLLLLLCLKDPGTKRV